MNQPPSPPLDKFEMMPPGIHLYMALKAFQTKALLTAVELIEDGREAEVSALTADELESSRSQLHLVFRDIKYDLLGSDEVTDINIFPPGKRDTQLSMLNVDFLLKKDGSPYLPQGFDLNDSKESSRIIMIVGEESPPFYVTQEALDNSSPDSNGISGTEIGYLNDLHAQGLEPRWLSDAEINQFINMLPQLEIDPVKQKTETMNLYLAIPPEVA